MIALLVVAAVVAAAGLLGGSAVLIKTVKSESDEENAQIAGFLIAVLGCACAGAVVYFGFKYGGVHG